MIGRLEKGDVQIVDLTPLDQWSPRVNGVPRGRTVWTRGKDINFYVPGGRYRITVHGEGFSISARGQGIASLDGARTRPGRRGRSPSATVQLVPLPPSLEHVQFGAPRPGASTAKPVKP